jgi:hypothetical protein
VKSVRLIVLNLAMLGLAVLPVCLLLSTVEHLAWLGSRVVSLSALGDYLVFYATAVIPLLAGGLLHQVLLLLMPTRWPRRRLRLASVALSPTVPAFLVAATGGAVLFMLPLSLPLSVLLYSLAVRLPDRGPPE